MRRLIVLALSVLACADPAGPTPVSVELLPPRAAGSTDALTPTVTLVAGGFTIDGRIGTATPCYSLAAIGQRRGSTMELLLRAVEVPGGCADVLVSRHYRLRVSTRRRVTSIRLRYQGGWPDTTFVLSPP